MKQVILIRTDLRMSKGKMIAQGAHASVSGSMKLGVYFENISLWKAEGMPKIILKVDSEAQLKALVQLALKAKLNAGFITDAGKTTFNGVATVTCGWIGPNEDVKVDLITDRLPLL